MLRIDSISGQRFGRLLAFAPQRRAEWMAVPLRLRNQDDEHDAAIELKDEEMKYLFATSAMAGLCLVFGSLGPAAADCTRDVDNAFALCSFFNKSEALSLTERCKVSGGGASVNIVSDMTPAEAKHVCEIVPDMQKKLDLFFPKCGSWSKVWTIRIYSPYSGQRTIAICDLE